jgi:DNA invertase Pin-like site-specific DNA recombinase
MDSGIKFKAVDNPHATNLTIHILSAVAQDEAERISIRVKEGLAQSDKQLGTPENLTLEARKRGIESIKHKASINPHNKRALAFVRGLDYSNMKLREIAEQLNYNEFKKSTMIIFFVVVD